jgi:hypothetical protein
MRNKPRLHRKTIDDKRDTSQSIQEKFHVVFNHKLVDPDEDEETAEDILGVEFHLSRRIIAESKKQKAEGKKQKDKSKRQKD